MNRALIIAAVTIAVCVGLVWWADGRGYDRATGEFTAAQLEKERAARTIERNMQDAADQKAREYEARRAILAADLAATGGAYNRLRADLATIGGGDTATPSSPDAARIAGLFGECAGEVVRLAGEADTLAAKLTGLQDWARVVAPSDLGGL